MPLGLPENSDNIPLGLYKTKWTFVLSLLIHFWEITISFFFEVKTKKDEIHVEIVTLILKTLIK